MGLTYPRVDGHVRTEHPLYWTWYGIVSRCDKPGHPSFPYYGARGISVCDRWRGSFDAFVADMGPRPTDKHSVDRVDNDGNYEPGNVRWATSSQQNSNRRYRVPMLLRETCRGHIALREWAAHNSLGQRVLAEMIGVAGPCAWAWLCGKNRPDHHFRIALERIAGIPAVSWLTDDEWLLAYGEPRPVTAAPAA